MALHQRLCDDVNMAEDTEQRRLEAGEEEEVVAGDDGEGAAAAMQWRASPGGEGRAARHGQPPDIGGSGAVPMEGVGESDDDEVEGEEDADAARETTDPYLGVAPCPPNLRAMYPGSLGLLRQQASAIIAEREAMRAKSTYKVTYTSYKHWHLLAFRTEAPHCELTGNLWLDRETGTNFMSWMAVNATLSLIALKTTLQTALAHAWNASISQSTCSLHAPIRQRSST